MIGGLEMTRTNDLTKGERIVLEYVQDHPGITFTAYDIEAGTGVRAEVIPWIVENLRYKGHKVYSKNGKHYWPSGSWKGYLYLFLLFGAIGYMFFFYLLQELDRAI